MRSELRKLTVLPTPRWTLFAVVLAAGIAAGVVAFTGPGDDSLALNLGVGLPTWIASLAIGVWMTGLEYGQKTMRRTISRNPNRLNLIATKLAVAMLATTALTVIATVVAAPLLALAASGSDSGIPVGDTLRFGLGMLMTNFVYTMVGFSLGLATRSMAGGMTIALAFFFVFDGALKAIPKAGDFMLSSVNIEIFQKIVGTELAGTDVEVHLVQAILVSAVWVAAFVGLSSFRFLRSDID